MQERILTEKSFDTTSVDDKLVMTIPMFDLIVAEVQFNGVASKLLYYFSPITGTTYDEIWNYHM